MGFEEIAGAANSLEETRIFGVDLDFLTQAADADVHTARREEMFAAPDHGEEFFAREDAPRMGSQMIEKAEFEQAGGDGFTGAGDVAGSEIDCQMVEFERCAGFGGGFGAPKEKFDAGDQFAGAEGFGDVIIGARLESRDQIGFATTSGEHDDGETMEQIVLASFGENLQTGDAWKQGVEKEEVGGGLFESGSAGGAVGGFGNMKTGLAQLITDEYNSVWVVLDNENTFHWGTVVGKQWEECTAEGVCWGR